MTEDDFLRAIVDNPAEAGTTWLVLADWLEERGDRRCELVRLLHEARRSPLSEEARKARIGELLAAGTRPLVPTFTNSIGMKLARIEPGTFLMGSPDDEPEREPTEGPQHEVEITRPFFLGVFQVTQEEYQRVTRTNPSHYSAEGEESSEVTGMDTRRFPVEGVSWEDAAAFCQRLSKVREEKKAGRVYRLPTEAEWEYACRGGPLIYTVAPFTIDGPRFSLSSRQANFDGNDPYGKARKGPDLQRPCPVGSYPANLLGLHDMQGNVWEWCADWFAYNYYQRSPRRDPRGPKRGEGRVLRGGSWGSEGTQCRATDRNRRVQASRDPFLGFRVACDVPSVGTERRKTSRGKRRKQDGGTR